MAEKGRGQRPPDLSVSHPSLGVSLDHSHARHVHYYQHHPPWSKKDYDDASPIAAAAAAASRSFSRSPARALRRPSFAFTDAYMRARARERLCVQAATHRPARRTCPPPTREGRV